MKTLYFDNAASTCVAPEALDAMLPYFAECYANASALHSPAQRAKAAVEEARETVAELIGADDPSEIIFTSGATEGNNQVLNTFSGRMLVSAIEHPSVANPAEESGRSQEIRVDSEGSLDYEHYSGLLKTRPELVSVMLVNNEIGSVQDIDQIGTMAKEAGALFHSDITQGVGKTDLGLAGRPIDYATLSGHKIHAPKGIGALWARSGAPLKRFMVGGTHERMRRSGTLNVPGIVGLGVAARLMIDRGKEEAARMAVLRDRIIREVSSNVSDVRVNGQAVNAPHILSLSFYRTEGESVIINLDSQGICCTAGSACSSGMNLKSRVLTAIGLSDEWLRGTIRISLSRYTTDTEVDELIGALTSSVAMVRSLAGYATG
ncbi:MAG: cysteine desulfurase [Fimbriimonadales bacterium]|nr:cysteine desulfurase [Fimbriimonadales bacterium]